MIDFTLYLLLSMPRLYFMFIFSVNFDFRSIIEPYDAIFAIIAILSSFLGPKVDSWLLQRQIIIQAILVSLPVRFGRSISINCASIGNFFKISNKRAIKNKML